MNYPQIYNKLIDRARTRKLKCYVEKHHIIPECMGGLDTSENLVELTPEEHYLAHQLLIRVYPNDDRMVFAAQMMTVGRPTNKLYGWLRRRAAKAIGDYNRGYKHTPEAREKIRLSKIGKKRKKNGQPYSAETIARCKIAHTGKKAISNGICNKMLYPGQSMPEGFKIGSLKFHATRERLLSKSLSSA
jgi:hypothetical protein